MENLRFFGQILHPQWPIQTSKMGQKWTLFFKDNSSKMQLIPKCQTYEHGIMLSIDTSSCHLMVR
jgi:hypothetical protein